MKLAETSDQILKDFILFKILFIYFLERGEGKRTRGRETSVCVASHVPPTRYLATNPGMCPRLGIELVTLCFAGPCSTH